MYLFIEKRLRGRSSYIAKGYSKANNKYMKNYDSTKLSIYISYLDMNNLYGCGMSDYLPCGGFKWLKIVDNFDKSISEKSPIGHILEVDLEYPNKLHIYYTRIIHQLQKDFQFLMTCCQIIVKKIADEYEIKVCDVMKLIPNLGEKTNYVLHYRNLQL